MWTHMALYFPAEKRRVASQAHQQLLVFLPLGSLPHTFPRGPSLPFCWGGKRREVRAVIGPASLLQTRLRAAASPSLSGPSHPSSAAEGKEPASLTAQAHLRWEPSPSQSSLLHLPNRSRLTHEGRESYWANTYPAKHSCLAEVGSSYVPRPWAYS